MDLREFKANLVYRTSSRTARATQRNPVLKNKAKQNKHHKDLNKHIISVILETGSCILSALEPLGSINPLASMSEAIWHVPIYLGDIKYF